MQKLPSVNDIAAFMESIAPPETAESYDNVGLLTGRRDTPVSRVLVALDATPEVVGEAVALGAEMIISHHPLMFHPIRTLEESTPEAQALCALVRGSIALYAAHTNLDKSPYSGSMALANALALSNARTDDCLVLGELAEDMPLQALVPLCESALRASVRVYGHAERVRTLAVAGGAADEFWPQARALGAQALLTGEVRHHNGIAASASGFVLLEGGHCQTEVLFAKPLARCLQNHFRALQYTLDVFTSVRSPYGGALT